MTVLRWSEATWIELPWTDGQAALGWMLGETRTFAFQRAPKGLKTRRQLRDAGLSPGGQEPFAQLVWRVYSARPRWGWLWRVDLAVAKRAASPAQLAAAMKATQVRLAPTCCPECGEYAGFTICPEAGRIHCDPPVQPDRPGWAVAA